MPIKPFYKAGDSVRILPMTKEMKDYSGRHYDSGMICKIRALIFDDYVASFTTPVFSDSFVYIIELPKDHYYSEAYVYESMIAPADSQPLEDVEYVYDASNKYKVYRPIGRIDEQDLYCVIDDGYLTTKPCVVIDL